MIMRLAGFDGAVILVRVDEVVAVYLPVKADKPILLYLRGDPGPWHIAPESRQVLFRYGWA